MNSGPEGPRTISAWAEAQSVTYLSICNFPVWALEATHILA